MTPTSWLKTKTLPLKETWELIIGIAAIIASLSTSFEKVEVRIAINFIIFIITFYLAYNIVTSIWKKVNSKKEKIIYFEDEQEKAENILQCFILEKGYKISLRLRRYFGILIVLVAFSFIFIESYISHKAYLDVKQLLLGTCVPSTNSPSDFLIYFDQKSKLMYGDILRNLHHDNLDGQVKSCLLQREVTPYDFIKSNSKIDIFISERDGSPYLYSPTGYLVKSGKKESLQEIIFSIKLILAEKTYRQARKLQDPKELEKKILKSRDILDRALLNCQKDLKKCNKKLHAGLLAQAYFLLAKVANRKKNPAKRIIGYLDVATELSPNMWKAYLEKIKVYSSHKKSKDVNNEIKDILIHLQKNAPPWEKSIATLAITETYGCNSWSKVETQLIEVENYTSYLDHFQLSNIYIDIGYIFFNCGYYSRAEDSFRKSRSEDKSNIYAISGIGKSLLFQKRFNDAKPTYQLMKKEFPSELENIIYELEVDINSTKDNDIKKNVNEILIFLKDV